MNCGNRTFPKAITDLENGAGLNKKIQQKITDLTNAIIESLFEGLGKPEPLKHELSGLWSCRILKKTGLFMNLLTI